MGSRIQLDLSGRRVLVTGAARGIGASIACALGDSGAAVVVNYCTSAERAEELVRELASRGRRAMAIQGDVSDVQSCVDLVRQSAEALGGPIDILVNNAGGPSCLSSLDKMTSRLWQDVLALNLTSVMVCSREVMGGMKANGWGANR